MNKKDMVPGPGGIFIPARMNCPPIFSSPIYFLDIRQGAGGEQCH